MSITNHKLHRLTVFVPLAITIGIIQFLRHSPSTVSVTSGIRYQQSSSIMAASYQDYMKEEYRAFLFATHPTHGMLLLHCSQKKNKPPHFQTPGGHVDKEDFDDAIARTPEYSHEGPALLITACRIGVARELYEETGIDVRSALDRLHPVRLRENSDSDKSIFCEFKKRLFFKLSLDEKDFVAAGIESMNSKPPPLKIRLSEEHQGFIFERDVSKSVDMLVEYSGGKVSKALKKAIAQNEIISTEEKDNTLDTSED